ncbi:MAG TPA: DUF1285 domain-containing protein [Syntrophales bacterium]|nr:DUF1285 domain-containing protein [Syntrophales bacterium]
MENDITPSGIRIDKDGVWYYNGNEIFRDEIVRYFYQNLKRDEAGRYLIELDGDCCYLEVEDAPFVVRAVYRCTGRTDNEDFINLLLSDYSIEKLNPDSLWAGKGNVLYCSVKENTFVARFSRASYYQLANFIECGDNEDEYFIWLNGKHFLITVVS